MVSCFLNGSAMASVKEPHKESSDSSVIPKNNQAKKTVSEITSSISDEEVSELLKNGKKLKDICIELLKCSERNSEKEEEISNLRKIIRKTATKSEHLQHLIRVFLPQREGFLRSLKKYADKMDIITKLCNAGKLVSSVVDCASVIGSTVIKRTNSENANIMLEIANGAGLIGFASSALEVLMWKTIIEDLVWQIQNDQNFFDPILEWFQQNNELERAVEVIIPLHLAAHIVNEFEKSIEKELSNLELFQNVLTAVLMQDWKNIRNATLIQNLLDFIACPTARHWCRWVFLRHHKVTLDVARMLLQLNSPQKLVCSQSIGTLTRFGSNYQSVAVFGRMALNCMNMYDAICTLRNGGMVEEIRKLERHLQQEMKALVLIGNQIQLRRPN